MSIQVSSTTVDVEALRRRVAHELYQKFAFTSFVIWTAGCLLLFAAGNPRPVFPAMLSMTSPLIPAALIWVAYRPLVNRQLARRLSAGQDRP